MTEEINTPGAPGDFLVNKLVLGQGSVLKMETGEVEAVTWLIFYARGTDRPDNTVRHSYALTDSQLLHAATQLLSHAHRRGLLP